MAYFDRLSLHNIDNELQEENVVETPIHQCSSLQHNIQSPPSHSTAPSADPPSKSATSIELANERQTLLLMLLGQVCSLHDATPRTFVVHVIALYERGILDSNSIKFLFELGLVPSGYDLNRNSEKTDEEEGVIVPYGDIRQCQPPLLPFQTIKDNIRKDNLDKNQPKQQCSKADSQQSKKMAYRQKEASAIRNHLERHESLESSIHSIYESSYAISSTVGNIAVTSPVSSTTSSSNSNKIKDYDVMNRSYLSRTLTSFDDSSFRQYTPANRSQHRKHIPSFTTPSWSVEDHPLSLSRYQREFHQLSLLATGSFGSVYHATHKLEQLPYAVKCVTFSTVGYYAETLALVIREVRCLAQLDHRNCVRYYTSWLEPSWMTGDSKDAFETDSLDNDEEDLVSKSVNVGPRLLTDIERVIDGLHNTEGIESSVEQLEAILYGSDDMDDGFNWSSSSPQKCSHPREKKKANDWDNLPSYYTSNNAGDDSDVSKWTQDLKDDSEADSFDNQSQHLHVRQGSNELVKAIANVKNKKKQQQYKQQNSTSSTFKYQITLYIQMQLCNSSTLTDWIKHRNTTCKNFDADERQARAGPAFEVFRHIVNGLAHVHAKDIVHRDLKPTNIFAGDDGTFMIGDFGLSKMMRDANRVNIDTQTNAIILPISLNDNINTAGVGTASYAAPEQMTSKTYGTPADIYSLGLILLELFSNFTSEHERAKAFYDVRNKREVAPWLKRYYPEVSALILACTELDWNRRPTASEIEARAIFQERGNGVEILKAELKTKDRLIENLNDQLKEKEELIQKLQLRHLAIGI